MATTGLCFETIFFVAAPPIAFSKWKFWKRKDDSIVHTVNRIEALSPLLDPKNLPDVSPVPSTNMWEVQEASLVEAFFRSKSTICEVADARLRLIQVAREGLTREQNEDARPNELYARYSDAMEDLLFSRALLKKMRKEANKCHRVLRKHPSELIQSAAANHLEYCRTCEGWTSRGSLLDMRVSDFPSSIDMSDDDHQGFIDRLKEQDQKAKRILQVYEEKSIHALKSQET